MLTDTTRVNHLSIQGLWKWRVESDCSAFKVKPVSVFSCETQADATGSRVSVDTELGYDLSSGAVLSDRGKYVLTTKT